MTQSTDSSVARAEITVGIDPDRAFERFTAEIDEGGARAPATGWTPSERAGSASSRGSEAA